MTADLLRLEHVSKWVSEGEGRTDILKKVSLSLRAGEFLAIMGASGSGKSTLLNILGLLDSASEGMIRLAGQDISKLSEDELAALRAKTIGFVFQTFNLLPYLTAQENVELPMAYTQREDAHIRSRKLLTDMKLEHRLKAYPKTLSGGERQRVAIARALANEPSLILADEPTGSLDSHSGSQVMDLLNDLHRKGTTVVLVTHDDHIAQRAQRVLHMTDGRFK